MDIRPSRRPLRSGLTVTVRRDPVGPLLAGETAKNEFMNPPGQRGDVGCDEDGIRSPHLFFFSGTASIYTISARPIYSDTCLWSTLRVGNKICYARASSRRWSSRSCRMWRTS